MGTNQNNDFPENKHNNNLKGKGTENEEKQGTVYSDIIIPPYTIRGSKQLKDIKNEEPSIKIQSKQEQVEKIITEFLSSGDEEDKDESETGPVSVRMAICKKEESGAEEKANIAQNNPSLLEVAKETVSSVIDNAKLEVMKINQQKGKDKMREQEIKSGNDGAIGLRNLLSNTSSNEDSSIDQKQTYKKEGEKLSMSKVPNKQKEVEAMITEFLQSDDEEENENIEAVTVEMAICKKETESSTLSKIVPSPVELENHRTVDKNGDGALNLRSSLIKEKQDSRHDAHGIDYINKTGHLKIKIFEAKDLKNIEIIGKSDPYVSIQYEGEIVRSETKKNTLNPSWNWETSVDLKDFCSDLILTIFDSDEIGKDQKMGSIIFKKESMKNYIADQPIWLSFTDDKPGQVLVFFELIDKPESKLPKGNMKQGLKDDIALRSEDNEEQNKITTNENQVPSKGNEVNSKDIQRAGTLKKGGNVDNKHNMDLENQIINDKSEDSNQTSKGASGLRNLLNEEDKLGSMDDKVLTIEIAKHVDPRKDKDDNVPDQIAKPGQNEGARGLRDILSEGDKDNSRNVQESKNGSEKPLDPKIDTKIDIPEKSSNAESLDALPKSETSSKQQKLGDGADHLRNILDHKKEIPKTENEHDKLKVAPSQRIKKDNDKQDASKTKDGAEVILNNETSMSVEDEYGSEKDLKSKTGKYTREDKKDIEPTDEVLESQADKTKGDVQAKSNEGAEGLKEIHKRQTDSNETVKLEQEHIFKETATFEGTVGLRKILIKKDKVGAPNWTEGKNQETSISVNDGYLAEKETSNEGKDSKEAKEETKPDEGKSSEETDTKESKEETELSGIAIRADEGAEGVREILGQPKDNENAGKIEKENVPENTARHEGAVGLRKILNEKENDKTVDKNISHSNKQGITQINVDSDHIEDTNRENNEAENGLTNLKNMTDLIRIKLDNKSNQRRSEPGTRYSFSTITEVKTFQSTEEIKETIAGDLLKTRSAIKKRRTVIIQETIVMIVESVSNWLDKVEYRISTVKKIKTVNQKKQELKSIKEEIEVIEETVDELVEVTEMAVEVIDDESKVTITSCVSCLNDQVKVVKLYHQQSEDELSDSEEKWEEYVEGIKTIERLIKDLRSEVDKLGKNDNISEEKVDTLEQYQMMNKGHMNKVVYLMATGKGLTDQLPENQIPEQVYTIYEKAKMIDTAIQNEKEETINLILSKDEYENTLAEYREIVDVAEDFLKYKLAVLDLSHFNEEIVRQKKFFLNLSHCMQVLDSLEANFSEQTKQHYSAVYEDLHKRSKQIIENSARYINDLDETLSSWSTINSEISALKSELEIVKTRISNFDSCTTYNYLEQLENCKRYELQLEALRIKSIIFQEKSEQLQQNISSPALNNLFTELNYEIPNMLDVINKDIEKYKSFRTLWKEYEDIQTTIQ